MLCWFFLFGGQEPFAEPPPVFQNPRITDLKPARASQLIGEVMGRPKAEETVGRDTTRRRKKEKALRRELSGPDPIVRIGLMEEYDRIEFTVRGDYDIVTLGGQTIEKRSKGGQRWRVLPSKTIEARAIYSVLTTAFASREAADSLRKVLALGNQPARVVEVGEQIMIDSRMVADNIKYRVLVGRWPTPREATRHLDEFRDEFAPRVVRQVIDPASGMIQLDNLTRDQSQDVEIGFRMIPRQDSCMITLHDVREGTGFHWEREVDRSYPGIIEIRVDHRGLLMAVTELPLELYLKGVVPSEMPASYPMEALKAQAVAARSEALARIGMRHPNDPFDLCAHVHCQAYSGCTHHDDRASKAVEDTRGYVLIADSMVAEAVYSSCCGGHTEDKLSVWNPPDAAHLHGHWDAAPDAKLPGRLDLTTEKGVAKWIGSSPPVWCNTAEFPKLPESLKKAASSFRWELTYSRRELEEIIRRKTGEDVGTLINIIPLQRGVSGRMMEMEILGTRKNLRLQRELNIRNALSPTYLRSACFVVSYEAGEDGMPLTFHLRGAGWGHGVGMCQVGAGVMAANGKSFKAILNHYYQGTKVEKIYGQ